MVKVLTWNVAALRPLPPKLPGGSLASFFKAQKADIVCLQETKIADYSKLTKELAVVDGYESFFSFSGKGYAGIATFARRGSVKWWTDNPFNVEIGSVKQKASKTQVLEDPDTAVDTSIGRCVLTDHESFLLLNIYAPNAGRGPEYLARKFTFYSKLEQCVAKWQAAGRCVIVTGDINTAHSELDIYNPERFAETTGFMPEERQWITDFLKKQNMSDAFRRLHPDKRKYSFWDQKRDMRPGNYGWRIDAFYCSDKLFDTAEKDVVESDILNDVRGSDHCPITLSLPHIQLSSELKCKDASSNRPEVNQRRIDGFFSKSVKGQGAKTAAKREATTDDENEDKKRLKS
ncbi:Endonuclease/exonuclease/phosphatase [Protomyces lactucae-debilis]|uniref:Endonuclease/exonuclease/phosphatase n=1 Tax=Protomyces lactucae-debilis TaxID=2754530 RepID=A0A1Y2F469_PROLT|nr:Endonuclease/exonuclease/phosphatase [Protomyces lactucae-debilis]ORY78671.1 Endonuclease/exonuclease/phosphatase [Protomyces lactucae-debilis]